MDQSALPMALSHGLFMAAPVAPNSLATWLIHGRSSGTQLSGYNTTTFTATPLSSLRTECCGYLGAVLALRALLTHHDLLDPLTPFTARAHIDNQALVKRLSHHHQHSIRHSLHPDWDLIHSATKVLASIPVDLQAVHIKSHQDDSKPYEALTLPAKLNIQVDGLTHLAYLRCPQRSITPLSTQVPATPLLQGSQVTSQMIPTTLTAYYKPKQFKYFQTRHGWTQSISDSIDWKSSTSAYKHLSYGRRLAMFKLINGQWPTNKILHRHGKAPASLCPRCSNAVEDHDHVLTCSASCHFRDTKWTALSDHLKSKLRTPPHILLALTHGLQSWENGDIPPLWPLPDPSPTDPLLWTTYQAYVQQTAIGWNHLLRGHLSVSWAHAMTTYHSIRHPDQRYESSLWTSQLINSLRAYAMEQWNNRNDFVYGATLLATNARRITLLRTQTTTAYSNQISVPADERGHIFGLPLSQRLLHSPSALTAWLAIYRVGQLRLTSQIRQDKRRQGTIRKFLIRRATPRRPSSPV